MRAGRKLKLEMAHLARKGKRPAAGAWGREETHWEWVLKKLALLWSGLAVRVILDRTASQ